MTQYVLKLRVVSDDPELLNLYNVSVARMETKEYLENPHKDSGFDIYTPKGQERINPGETRLVNLEIQCAAYRRDGWNETFVPSAFYMYPRSSIYKTPLRLANNTGIIDSGYRGNLMGAFDNIYRPGSAYQESTWSQELNMYGRMLQICMPDLSPFKIEIVETLDDTSRGSGGLGSTGV